MKRRDDLEDNDRGNDGQMPSLYILRAVDTLSSSITLLLLTCESWTRDNGRMCQW